MKIRLCSTWRAFVKQYVALRVAECEPAGIDAVTEPIKREVAQKSRIIARVGLERPWGRKTDIAPLLASGRPADEGLLPNSRRSRDCSKASHPILQVAIYDAEKSQMTLVKA